MGRACGPCRGASSRAFVACSASSHAFGHHLYFDAFLLHGGSTNDFLCGSSLWVCNCGPCLYHWVCSGPCLHHRNHCLRHRLRSLSRQTYSQSLMCFTLACEHFLLDGGLWI